MTTKENIKAILACNFSGFKDECIETATNRIMETVNTTCPNCDSGYAQGYSDGYLKGKEERPQGKWVRTALYGQTCLQCNQCGKADFDIKYDKYCPNCGADMRGAKE